MQSMPLILQNTCKNPLLCTGDAENKLIGKTMGDLAKRNAPSVNKSALKITNLEYFSLNRPVSHHTSLYCPCRFFAHSLYPYIVASLLKSSRISNWKTGVEGVKAREGAELTCHAAFQIFHNHVVYLPSSAVRLQFQLRACCRSKV